MTKKFCITGLAGSGKDTVGAMLANLTGQSTYALADPIKEIVKALFGLSDNEINSRAFKEKERYMMVFPDNLDAAAEVYHKHGLSEYQEFSEAWESWVGLLRLRFEPLRGVYEQWLSPRTCFQTIGTEWGRALNDEIWLLAAPEDAIITDIRMDNEAEFFISKDYVLLEVVRPGLKTIGNSNHSTEAGIDKQRFLPHTIYNSSTIAHLGQYVANLV